MVCRFAILIFCLIAGHTALPQYQNKNGSLKLVITNIKNHKGEILISLHNKKEGFPGDKNFSLLTRAHKIEGDTVNCEFAKIPFGEYAVAIFHDENSNYQLDTNMLGIPKEGIGISNNAYKIMGPPDYEEAKFKLASEEKTILINMHYY